MKKFAILLSFALVLTGGVVFAQEISVEATIPAGSLVVAESAVCVGISDRQPEGTAIEFSKDTQKIYYWTKITGVQSEEKVKHVWYSGDTVINEVSLNVNTSPFRTWSSKTVHPGLEGEMSVAVIDAAGNVLKKDTFTIK